MGDIMVELGLSLKALESKGVLFLGSSIS